mmetsp:Transcript_13909/g.18561  ORF Transcript_13909/g.18561 Transcript_13909/m.18561 type:complete len:176 (-) Transcript_13909:1569-2096(-)
MRVAFAFVVNSVFVQGIERKLRMTRLRGGAINADVYTSGPQAEEYLLPPQIMSRRLTQYLLADIGWGLWLSMAAIENAPRTTRIVTLWASVCFLASSLSFFPGDVNWIALGMQVIMLCINIHRTIHTFRPFQIVPPSKTKRRLRFLLNRVRGTEGVSSDDESSSQKSTHTANESK